MHSRAFPRSKLADFSGDTEYALMFGPDICGYSTKKVHVILTCVPPPVAFSCRLRLSRRVTSPDPRPLARARSKDGKNHLTKKDIPCETDELTHVYTLHLKPDNSYEVFIDSESKHNGTLYEDFDILPAKSIKDAEAKKPETWDDRPTLPDESDVKPEGHDDIPAKIVDAEATKPDDWDDEDDGEWAAPMIPNPAYKGPWVQKTIPNPEYKGVWEAPMVDNPAFKDDPFMCALVPLSRHFRAAPLSLTHPVCSSQVLLPRSGRGGH